MIKQPPYLKKGDKIAIVCPAKKLKRPIDAAIALLQEWGLEVVSGKSVYASHHQFAGNDILRAGDLQSYLDDPDIKAVIAGRGGYGTIRILDMLDFSLFNQNPKWIVGFSDITALLSHVTGALNIQSIHGQMPGVFDEATAASLASLRKSLFGEPQSYTYTSGFPNQPGETEGILIGGNLSLLLALAGSASEMDFSGKILFLEDVGEYEYSIDRMMHTLKRSGKLAKLKGLIVGAFNGLKTEDIPFGQNPEQIIREAVKDYSYPVCFNFPVGHIDNNLTMILGARVSLKAGVYEVKLEYK